MRKKIALFLFAALMVFSAMGQVTADNSVPKDVMTSTESVVRIVAEYSDGYVSGSGFVVKSDSENTLVVTNYHVVEGEPYNITIWVGEDTFVTARVKAYSEQKDLCVLEFIYPQTLKALTLDKDGAAHGEAVYAVGFPAAADHLSDTVAHTSSSATITDGIVSAIRDVTIIENEEPVVLLQINAAINSGNSGGPLFDSKGNVVGINTYGVNDAQGIFGAIAVNELKTFLADNGIILPTGSNEKGGNAWVLILCVAGVLIVSGVVAAVIVNKKRRHSSGKKTARSMTLREYMSAYPEGLGENDAVALLMPVALKLRDMHNNGQAHLQVSADSVMVVNGKAKLLDSKQEESARYVSGFAAPEIYRGANAGNVSDIYSFCSLLSFAATGSIPENALERSASTEDEPVDTTDDSFNAFIVKGTSLDAKDRYSQIQELIWKLSAYNIPSNKEPVAKNPVISPAAEKPKKPAKVVRRRINKKAIIAVLSCFIIAVGLFAGVYFNGYAKAKRAAEECEFQLARDSIVALPLLNLHDANLLRYIEAGELMDNNRFTEAEAAFAALKGYLQAEEMVLESQYRHAAQLADSNAYASAIAIYTSLSEINYKDSASLILDTEFRWGCNLIEAEEYFEAYEKLDGMRGYPDADEALETLTDLIYNLGVEAYSRGFSLSDNLSNAEALKYFTFIHPYKNSDGYLTLLKFHGFGTMSSMAFQQVKSLEEIFYLEDASKLLLENEDRAKYFLRGTWKTSDGRYKFEVTSSGSISYTLPHFTFGNCNVIYYGDVWSCVDDHRPILYFYTKYAKLQFSIDLLTPDSMRVHCEKDGSTHILYRQ